MRAKQLLSLCSLAVAALSVCAFELESTPEGESYMEQGDLSLVTVKGQGYAIRVLPQAAVQYEISERTDTHRELKAKLNLGALVSKDEAAAVLEVLYRHTAFKFESVKIRNLKTSGLRYAVWCANPWAFGCLEWKGAAGTLVEYEINGENRSGGMVGYTQTTVLIRKPEAPSAVTAP